MNHRPTTRTQRLSKVNAEEQTDKKLPVNAAQLIPFLKTSKEKLYQNFNYFWVFQELFLSLKKIGLNVTDYCILYQIAMESDGIDAPIVLSRRILAERCCLSIDTINKVLPFLKGGRNQDVLYRDGKPLIITVTNKSFYHEHGQLIEKDSKSYKKGFVSETIKVNAAFMLDLKKCLDTLREKLPIKRAIVIPAIAQEFGMTLSQYYLIESCNSVQKMNKSGVKNKKETAETWGFSRQNFYTAIFKQDIKDNVLELKYLNEFGHDDKNRIIKVKAILEDEKKKFFDQQNIFTHHNKLKNTKKESAEVVRLWKMHASELASSITESNKLTELITGMPIIKMQSLGNSYLLRKYDSELEYCMEVFEDFSEENQKFYGKVKNKKLFESSLEAILDSQESLFSNISNIWDKIKDFVGGREFTSNQEIADYGININQFFQDVELYIKAYKEKVCQMLESVKIFE